MTALPASIADRYRLASSEGETMGDRVLHLTYDPAQDRLEALVPGTAAESRVGDGGWLLVCLDADRQPIGFTIECFRYFVDFYVLGEVFGEGLIKPLADFQTDVIEHLREATGSDLPWDGRSGAVDELARDGRLQPA